MYLYRKNGDHKLIGIYDTSIIKLLEFDQVLKFQNLVEDEMMLVEVMDINVRTIPSFLDYINAGIDMNLLIGIDFTASNGNPQYQNSLHYIHHNGNQYIHAIEEVGKIILNFDSDQEVPLFGFGGVIPKYYNDVSH